MNKNLRLRLAALFMGVMTLTTFAACSDDDDKDVLPEKPEQPEKVLEVKTITLPNLGYGEDNWIYFSFEKGEVLEGINESNRAEDTSWDLAFYRYNIRTNSGLSGKGKGGVVDTEKTELVEVAEAPAGEYTTDVMGEITANMSSFPPPTIESPLSEVLGNALQFQGPPPTYTPNNHVYVVKTANGKYAKIKILGFYNDEGKSGHVSFEYAYQADGTTNLNTK